MNPIIMSALAEEHIRDMHRAAARNRLAALARCCHPTVWRRALERVGAGAVHAREWMRRTQLGPAQSYCRCS